MPIYVFNVIINLPTSVSSVYVIILVFFLYFAGVLRCYDFVSPTDFKSNSIIYIDGGKTVYYGLNADVFICFTYDRKKCLRCFCFADFVPDVLDVCICQMSDKYNFSANRVIYAYSHSRYSTAHPLNNFNF